MDEENYGMPDVRIAGLPDLGIPLHYLHIHLYIILGA
jgi:hypothetical protein